MNNYKVYFTSEQGSRVHHVFAKNEKQAIEKVKLYAKRKYKNKYFYVNKVVLKGGEND